MRDTFSCLPVTPRSLSTTELTLTDTLKGMTQVCGNDANTSVKSHSESHNDINKNTSVNLKRKSQVEINLKSNCQVKKREY